MEGDPGEPINDAIRAGLEGRSVVAVLRLYLPALYVLGPAWCVVLPFFGVHPAIAVVASLAVLEVARFYVAGYGPVVRDRQNLYFEPLRNTLRGLPLADAALRSVVGAHHHEQGLAIPSLGFNDINHLVECRDILLSLREDVERMSAGFVLASLTFGTLDRWREHYEVLVILETINFRARWLAGEGHTYVRKEDLLGEKRGVFRMRSSLRSSLQLLHRCIVQATEGRRASARSGERITVEPRPK